MDTPYSVIMTDYITFNWYVIHYDANYDSWYERAADEINFSRYSNAKYVKQVAGSIGTAILITLMTHARS